MLLISLNFSLEFLLILPPMYQWIIKNFDSLNFKEFLKSYLENEEKTSLLVFLFLLKNVLFQL